MQDIKHGFFVTLVLSFSLLLGAWMGAAALTPKNMTDMTQWQGFMRGWIAGYSVVTHTGLERYVSDSSVTVMKHDDKIIL